MNAWIIRSAWLIFDKIIGTIRELKCFAISNLDLFDNVLPYSLQYFIELICLPVGDNCKLVACGIEPPPVLSGNLGGSIFQGALGNGPKSLFKFDPINIIWSLAIKTLCLCLCLSSKISHDLWSFSNGIYFE